MRGPSAVEFQQAEGALYGEQAERGSRICKRQPASSLLERDLGYVEAKE